MTNIVSTVAGTISKAPERRDIGIKRRYAAERRFRAYGIAAISFGLIFLAILLSTVIRNGYTAFQQTAITLPVEFAEKTIDPSNKRATDPSVLNAANYGALLRDAIVKKLNINASSRPDVRDATAMLSKGAPIQLRDMVVAAREENEQLAIRMKALEERLAALEGLPRGGELSEPSISVGT